MRRLQRQGEGRQNRAAQGSGSRNSGMENLAEFFGKFTADWPRVGQSLFCRRVPRCAGRRPPITDFVRPTARHVGGLSTGHARPVRPRECGCRCSGSLERQPERRVARVRPYPALRISTGSIQICAQSCCYAPRTSADLRTSAHDRAGTETGRNGLNTLGHESCRRPYLPTEDRWGSAAGCNHHHPRVGRIV